MCITYIKDLTHGMGSFFSENVFLPLTSKKKIPPNTHKLSKKISIVSLNSLVQKYFSELSYYLNSRDKRNLMKFCFFFFLYL